MSGVSELVVHIGVCKCFHKAAHAIKNPSFKFRRAYAAGEERNRADSDTYSVHALPS